MGEKKKKRGKKERRAVHRAEERSAFTPFYLSMRCSAGQFRARALSTSFFLISSRIIPASERRGLNDSPAISGDSRTFCLPSARDLRERETAEARSARGRTRTEKTSQRHPWTGNVGCRARLVKEFSAGCGTRSFLGDDVLKFTVGVRSSLLLTGIPGSYELRESDFYSVRPLSRTETCFAAGKNEFVIHLSASPR